MNQKQYLELLKEARRNRFPVPIQEKTTGPVPAPLPLIQEDIVLEGITDTLKKIANKVDIKKLQAAIKAKNIGVLKSLLKSVPKMKIEKVEAMASKVTPEFKGLYIKAQKEVTSSLPKLGRLSKAVAGSIALLSIAQGDKTGANIKKNVAKVRKEQATTEDIVMGSLLICLAIGTSIYIVSTGIVSIGTLLVMVGLAFLYALAF